MCPETLEPIEPQDGTVDSIEEYLRDKREKGVRKFTEKRDVEPDTEAKFRYALTTVYDFLPKNNAHTLRLLASASTEFFETLSDEEVENAKKFNLINGDTALVWLMWDPEENDPDEDVWVPISISKVVSFESGLPTQLAHLWPLETPELAINLENVLAYVDERDHEIEAEADEEARKELLDEAEADERARMAEMLGQKFLEQGKMTLSAEEYEARVKEMLKNDLDPLFYDPERPESWEKRYLSRR